MEQLQFDYSVDVKNELRHIVRLSYQTVKKRFPSPVFAESYEDYKLFLQDETLLEIADRLQKIALKRQNNRISIMYSKDCDE